MTIELNELTSAEETRKIVERAWETAIKEGADLETIAMLTEAVVLWVLAVEREKEETARLKKLCRDSGQSDDELFCWLCGHTRTFGGACDTL